MQKYTRLVNSFLKQKIINTVNLLQFFFYCCQVFALYHKVLNSLVFITSVDILLATSPVSHFISPVRTKCPFFISAPLGKLVKWKYCFLEIEITCAVFVTFLSEHWCLRTLNSSYTLLCKKKKASKTEPKDSKFREASCINPGSVKKLPEKCRSLLRQTTSMLSLHATILFHRKQAAKNASVIDCLSRK